LTKSGSFILAPSLTALVPDKTEFGYGVGAMVPFVWVTDIGLRIGFEVSMLVALGGEARYRCIASSLDGPCETGEVRAFDRQRSSGFTASFTFGYGVD